MGIHSIRIRNFKSIRDSGKVELKPINILIGPNGVGKSNFIEFFKLLNRIYEQRLQTYVARHGRAENFLYFGSKRSSLLGGTITFDNDWINEYKFTLEPDQASSLFFTEEFSICTDPSTERRNRKLLSSGGNEESKLKDSSNFRDKYLRDHFSNLKVFHFHDTSFNAKVRLPCKANDYAFLREDGGNLPAFLYKLKKRNPSQFKIIQNVVRSVAPFFREFYLEPDEVDSDQMLLRWTEEGAESDQYFNAQNLSDGTLRMICLTTLLMQPSPPGTIIIDEPELGLHPLAIEKVASMIKSTSTKAQVIISTQSVTLLDQFLADDILVVERSDNQSVFRRLQDSDLAAWLEDYSIGQLWGKNILGGMP